MRAKMEKATQRMAKATQSYECLLVVTLVYSNARHLVRATMAKKKHVSVSLCGMISLVQVPNSCHCSYT